MCLSVKRANVYLKHWDAQLTTICTNVYLRFYNRISLNHITAEAGRHLWGVSAQSRVRSPRSTVWFWISARTETQSLSGQPVPVINPSFFVKLLSFFFFSSVLMEFPVFYFVPIATSGSTFFTQFMHIAEIVLSLLSPWLSSPCSLSHCSHVRCSSPLNVSTALHWPSFSNGHVSCTTEPSSACLFPLGRHCCSILRHPIPHSHPAPIHTQNEHFPLWEIVSLVHLFTQFFCR